MRAPGSETVLRGERVPLLSDVLALETSSSSSEVKGLPTRVLVDGIAREVQRMDAVDRVKFTSFHLAALGQLQQLLPEAQFGLFSPMRRPWMSDHLYEQVVTETAVGGRFDVVHIPSRHLHLFDVTVCTSVGSSSRLRIPRRRRSLNSPAESWGRFDLY